MQHGQTSRQQPRADRANDRAGLDKKDVVDIWDTVFYFIHVTFVIHHTCPSGRSGA